MTEDDTLHSVPVALLFNTRKIFPELYSQKSPERAKFYMTEQKKVPRKLISSIQSETGSRVERKKRNFIYVRPA